MKEKMINNLIFFCIIILIGYTIKKTIEKEYPEVYQDYLNERASWKWYKKMWYIK